jgi:hypothetical protein
MQMTTCGPISSPFNWRREPYAPAAGNCDSHGFPHDGIGGLTARNPMQEMKGERKWTYDRKSHIGQLDKALDETKANGWTVVDMKQDWKVIYPPAK